MDNIHNRLCKCIVNRRRGQKHLQCPSCERKIVNKSDIEDYQLIPRPHQENNHILKIIHKTCPCQNPRALYVCLGCGTRNKRPVGARRHCKCNKASITPSILLNSTSAPTPVSKAVIRRAASGRLI